MSPDSTAMPPGARLRDAIKTNVGITTRVDAVPADRLERTSTGKARRVLDLRAAAAATEPVRAAA